jgi:DNA-binding transcriptional ArsR family regulator
MPEPVEALDLSEVRCHPVRVSITPLPSLAISALEALDDPIHACRAPWRDEIRNRLTEKDLAALLPLRGPGWHPSCAIPTPEAPAASVDDELDRLRSIPIEVIEAEVDGLRDGPGKPNWMLARRGAARWRRAYIDALARAWEGYAPVWDRAASALDREIERLGAGVAMGAVGELLTSVHPRSHVVGDEWRIRSDYTRQMSLADGPLCLTPVIHPTRRVLLHDDDHDGLCAISYPLPGFDPYREPDLTSPLALAGLLGARRAMLLQRLDRPLTIGALAELLHAVPSAATHHVQALARAGLVQRERAGKHVLVRRTSRGTALLELYSY